MTNTEAEERPIVIPGTRYILGSTLQIHDHRFILTDTQERIELYAQAGVPMTIVTEHRGTFFAAPYNNMALGLIQFTISLEKDRVVGHYWMFEEEYDEIVKIHQAREEQEQQQQAAVGGGGVVGGGGGVVGGGGGVVGGGGGVVGVGGHAEDNVDKDNNVENKVDNNINNNNS
eukprot:GHVR01086176.1.p1 GENE.GHVR01086176.1~~GHVR01086176.1.p1  ORF type:complete len:173 (+),score=70.68 GHVR01086176.1:67-585(+)